MFSLFEPLVSAGQAGKYWPHQTRNEKAGFSKFSGLPLASKGTETGRRPKASHYELYTNGRPLPLGAPLTFGF